MKRYLTLLLTNIIIIIFHLFMNNSIIVCVVSQLLYNIIFMIVPFVIFKTKRKIDKNKLKKIYMYNSMIVFLMITTLVKVVDYNYNPSLFDILISTLYYYVNIDLFINCGKEKIELKSKKKTNSKKIKTIYCKQCGGKLDENKICNKCGKQYFHITKTKIIIFILSLIIVILSVVIAYLVSNININKKNNNLKTKSTIKTTVKSTTKVSVIDPLHDGTDNTKCPYEKSYNVKRIEVIGQSMSGIGDIFPTTNHNIDYRIRDNSRGEQFDVIYKLSINDNVHEDYYNCDDWYYVKGYGIEGYLWGGQYSQYVEIVK